MNSDLKLMLGVIDEIHDINKVKRDNKEKLKKEECVKKVIQLRDSGLYEKVIDINETKLHMDINQFIQYLISERKSISQLHECKEVKLLGLFNSVELEVTEFSTVENLLKKYEIGIEKWADSWIKEI